MPNTSESTIRRSHHLNQSCSLQKYQVKLQYTETSYTMTVMIIFTTYYAIHLRFPLQKCRILRKMMQTSIRFMPLYIPNAPAVRPSRKQNTVLFTRRKRDDSAFMCRQELFSRYRGHALAGVIFGCDLLKAVERRGRGSWMKLDLVLAVKLFGYLTLLALY
jgi:hypothetical protein